LKNGVNSKPANENLKNENGKVDQKLKREFVIEEKREILLQCLAKGLFLKLAFLNNSGCYTIYVTLNIFLIFKKSNQDAYIHPDSLVFYAKKKPNYVLYNSVVWTTKIYLRDVTEIPYGYVKEYIRN